MDKTDRPESSTTDTTHSQPTSLPITESSTNLVSRTGSGSCDSISSPSTPVHSQTSDPSVTLLARGKAQLMVIDESTGLWIARKDVQVGSCTITKELVETSGDSSPVNKEPQYRYFIKAYRLADQKELFRDELKPDSVYHRAAVTFHHWATGKVRHGLTFIHLTDAKKFERTATKTIQQMNPGAVDNDDVFSELVRSDLVLESGALPPGRPHKPSSLYEDKPPTTTRRSSPPSNQQASPGKTSLKLSRTTPANPTTDYSDYRNDCFQKSLTQNTPTIKPSNIDIKTLSDPLESSKQIPPLPTKKRSPRHHRSNVFTRCCTANSSDSD